MRPTSFFLAAGLAATTLAVSPVFAKPGDLDASFGTGGKVTTPVGTGFYDTARTLAVQPDGRVLAAGTAFNGTTMDFALVRYTSDGSLDASFGNGGIVTTSISTGDDSAQALVLQPDGKVLVAGFAHYDRTNADATNTDFTLVRYTSTGSLDPTFGNGGIVTTPIGPSYDWAAVLALQPDGKVLVAGSAWNGTDYDFALVRYTSTGSLDTAFGSGGKVITPIGGYDNAYALALQPDGKVLVAGNTSDIATYSEIALVRYTSDGSLDPTFGSSGIVTTPVGAGYPFGAGYSVYANASALVLQPDGRVLAAGFASNGTNMDFALVRYTSDGSLDTAFGSGGKVITPIGTDSDTAISLALQPDGKVLAVGTAYAYSAPCDDAVSVPLAPNGTALAAGATSSATCDDFALVRYISDGSLDPTFGSSGIVTTSFGGGISHDQAHALALQPDGTVLVAGQTYNPTNYNYDFTLVRYLAKDSNNDGVAEPWGLTPDAFTFTDVTGVATGSVQTSNLITISGLEDGVTVPLQVEGGEYALNGSTSYSTAPGWVGNGDRVNVRHRTPLGGGAVTLTTLTVGGLRASNNLALILGPTSSDTFTSATRESSCSAPPRAQALSTGRTGCVVNDTSSGGGGALGLLPLLGLGLVLVVRERSA